MCVIIKRKFDRVGENVSSKELWIYFNLWKELRYIVVANMMDRDVVGTNLELQSPYYVHFPTNTHEKV